MREVGPCGAGRDRHPHHPNHPTEYPTCFSSLLRATDRRAERYDPATTLVPTYIVTDCRSLFDLLTKMSAPGAGITEKRVAIDIFAIREILPKERVRCVPTYRMLADGMTKIMTPMKIWAVVTAERVALQGRVSFEEGDQK